MRAGDLPARISSLDDLVNRARATATARRSRETGISLQNAS
jgi:hypothetical protein